MPHHEDMLLTFDMMAQIVLLSLRYSTNFTAYTFA